MLGTNHLGVAFDLAAFRHPLSRNSKELFIVFMR
jgi:hypothetical protein